MIYQDYNKQNPQKKLWNIELVTRMEHKMMKFNKCHDVKETTLL